MTLDPTTLHEAASDTLTLFNNGTTRRRAVVRRDGSLFIEDCRSAGFYHAVALPPDELAALVAWLNARRTDGAT
jgi:hypothetical protein